MPLLPSDLHRLGALMRGVAARQAPVVITPRQYPWLVLFTCTLMGLMVVPWISTFSPGTTMEAAFNAFRFISLSVAFQMAINYVLRYGDNRLRHWLDYRPLWLNILLRVGIAFSAAALFTVVRFFLPHSWGMHHEQPRLINALAGSQIFAFIIIVVQLAIETMERSQYVSTENEQLKQEQLAARYEGLKQQLSPHFLFNSLSTLGSLIHEAPAAAEQFVEEIAEVYRYSLQHGEQTAVTLSEEVAFLRSYCYLLQMRFGESLDLHIDLPATVMARTIPPLALQLLVENVVKHNVFTRKRPLRVAIEFQAPATLLVRNTWQPRPMAAPSNGVGLSNLTSRIRMLHHQEVLVEQSADEFRVYVPLPA
ncbi:sensor histidine kinase [Hymenobacter properus]|uniref:Histidine kinase n=1 Tax=Hymenobacter properus TaxID=2791026 RepID=A0A931FLE4_9BACT|nr:histidine kinase [Hymenobacter properus]MBF9141946.1 histidine kinase [Hymenobacter properus]MBR7720753.1 histidine kinase [Microvirga sp. SRT04]